MPGAKTGEGEVFGWEFIDVQVNVTGTHFSEGNTESPAPLIVRISKEAAEDWLKSGNEELLVLDTSWMSNSEGVHVWVPVGGSFELVRGRDPAEIADVITLGVRAYEEIATEREENIRAALEALVADVGRLPLPGEPAQPPEERLPEAEQTAILLDLYNQPFVLELGETKIVFDRWFWALLDQPARVQVFKNGELRLEGSVSGASRVMSTDGGSTIFKDETGEIIARFTMEEITEAIDARLREAGIDVGP